MEVIFLAKGKKPSARTLEGRENQLIALAVDLAEKKLRDGTASSQIITTLLNLATTKYRLEMERIRSDILLKEAKVEEIRSSEDVKDMYEDAINAMQSYRPPMEDEEFYDEDD